MLDFSVKAQYLVHTKPSATIEDALVKLAEKSMTDLQKQVLIHIYARQRRHCYEDKTYSWHVREIIKQLGMAESTAKWSLNNLRESLLLECGTMMDRGAPLRITKAGVVIAERMIAKESLSEIEELT